MEIHTRHRFTAAYVQTWWRLLPEGRREHHDASLLFPSTGADTAITATLRDGSQVALVAGTGIPVADIAWVHLGGSECGYVVVPRSRALPGRTIVLDQHAQTSAPHAGPTLTFQLLSDARLRRLTASVRIAPARDAEHARSVAEALGAFDA